MNFKKTLTVAGLASLAVVGLVSCGSKDKASGSKDDMSVNVSLNLALNYNGASFITFGAAPSSVSSALKDGVYTTLDGKVLTPGKSLCPLWQELQTRLNIKFTDEALVGQTSTSNQQKTLIANHYKGDNGGTVDIMQVASNNDFATAVGENQIVNLSEHEDQLPNLFKFLDNSSSVKEQMMMGAGENKGIYFAPYFDGKDQIEKGFNMNVEATRALLDDGEAVYDATAKTGNSFKRSASLDTAATITTAYGGQGTGVTNSYIQSMNQEIAVYNRNKKKADKITVTFTKDVVTRQNELAVKNGANLVATLKSYLKEVYGDYVGEGKIFQNYSEIFTSSSACYNADELIALWRCFKTNPAYLTGNAASVMIPFFPRTGEASRVRALQEICQMFGLRGSYSGEKDLLYFNKDGILVDGRTQKYSYDCIEKMQAIKAENLIPENLLYDGENGKTEWRSNLMNTGAGFMCYDYYNVAAYNESSAQKGYAVDEMQAILSPVAKWDVQEYDGKTIVGYNKDEKVSYTRFSEDNRSLKDGGWCIIKHDGLSEEKLNRALTLIDYMYKQEGAFLECYGTDGAKNAYSTGEIVTDKAGVSYPVLTQAYKDEIKAIAGGSWHNYMARFMGCCLGIGNIRSNYLEAQVTNELQQVGMTKIAEAEGAGAMYQCTTGGTAFFKSVPTVFNITATQSESIKAQTTTLTEFWAQTSDAKKAYTNIFTNAVMKGWGNGGVPARATLEAEFGITDYLYLRYNAQAIGVDYLKTE